METIELELLQKVYKFLEKIEYSLSKEFSNECDQIKKAVKEIIPAGCDEATRHYENVYDYDGLRTATNTLPPRFDYHQFSNSNKNQTNEKLSFKSLGSNVKDPKENLRAVEHDTKLKNRLIPTTRCHSAFSRQSPNPNACGEHEYINMQFGDAKYRYKQPNPQIRNPSFSSPEDITKQIREEQMYKYTDNDVSLTLISPMLKSSTLAPQTEVEPSYVNTKLTKPMYFH